MPTDKKQLEFNRIAKILADNAAVPYVQRILNKDKFPVLKNKDGSVSTHSMAWSEADDGNYYVYPTVVQTAPDQLQRFDDNQAWSNAAATGNLIKFNNKKDADWFSKNYKKVWR